MSEPITLKLQPSNELVELAVRILHPMEAGDALDVRTGKAVPADFLQTIAIQLNEKTLLEGQLGATLAKNPVFSFSFKGVKAGDKFLVSCTDNSGRNFEQEITVPVFKNL